MKSVSPLKQGLPDDWQAVESGMKVVTLDRRLQAVVPLLAVSSLSRGTRGLTFFPGRTGVAVGSAITTASVAIAYALLSTGPAAPLLSLWILGTAGAAIFAASLRPTAFVKPICVRCRLLPVIKEHEAIHLTGVASEKAVWDSMRTRHSAKTLSLDGDPSICSFCPIPKRLSEH
ncbi:MAG: hypothetical protein JRM82_02560 [Nitrososphaerota archaeon]|nr:hypothetical protein [Nitrososphaerota archaeon]